MIKWIVYWVIWMPFQTSCPENRPGCSVYHAEYKPVNESREFDKKHLAISFYDSLRHKDTTNFNYQIFGNKCCPDSISIHEITTP